MFSIECMLYSLAKNSIFSVMLVISKRSVESEFQMLKPNVVLRTLIERTMKFYK